MLCSVMCLSVVVKQCVLQPKLEFGLPHLLGVENKQHRQCLCLYFTTAETHVLSSKSNNVHQ